jgi:hypothetical protein
MVSVMGKYALENYSPYDTYIIRPKPLPYSKEMAGRGQVTFLDYSWDELEKERGIYEIDKIHKAIDSTVNPVLVLRQTAPSWLKDASEECFSKLIRRVGSSLRDEKFLVGVIITSAGRAPVVWDAYLEAFEHIPVLADIHDRDLINYLKEKGVTFGLIVACDEKNWLDCCEAFARYRLQHTWEKAPVLLQVMEAANAADAADAATTNATDAAAGEHVSREALRWHAGYSNISMDLGFKFYLRRIHYPKKVSSKGALPIRFWFVNNGSAPCYMDFILKIKLKKDCQEYIINLNIDKKVWQLGDITHNEIVQLPNMEPGTYTLSTGVFFEKDTAMKLYIEMREDRGFYELGMLEVDTQNRDDLFHIWNDFYPDGYYPLEDPKEPN